MSGSRSGSPDTNSGWGGGGGGGGGFAVSVRLKPYYQTSAWDRAPTVLHCLSLCLNTTQYCVVTCRSVESRP